MKKLLFNHDTHSIVMQIGNNYYDMRRMQPCDKPTKFSKLRLFNKESKTAWKPNDLLDLEKVKSLSTPVEYGFEFKFNDLRIFLVFDSEDNYQLIGKVPQYFLKSFNRFIKK